MTRNLSIIPQAGSQWNSSIRSPAVASRRRCRSACMDHSTYASKQRWCLQRSSKRPSTLLFARQVLTPIKSNYFNQVVQRYKNTIAGQFYGHSHVVRQAFPKLCTSTVLGHWWTATGRICDRVFRFYESKCRQRRQLCMDRPVADSKKWVYSWFGAYDLIECMKMPILLSASMMLIPIRTK